jgi:hypothetical protein
VQTPVGAVPDASAGVWMTASWLGERGEDQPDLDMAPPPFHASVQLLSEADVAAGA